MVFAAASYFFGSFSSLRRASSFTLSPLNLSTLSIGERRSVSFTVEPSRVDTSKPRRASSLTILLYVRGWRSASWSNSLASPFLSSSVESIKACMSSGVCAFRRILPTVVSMVDYWKRAGVKSMTFRLLVTLKYRALARK